MSVVVFPGQGAQRRGMGLDLFTRYADQTAEAERVLGMRLADLVNSDRIGETQYTQPALFVVNALAYREWLEGGGTPRLAAGHSLGEYNALLAAGAFDFVTALRLIKLRGELMAQAAEGGMAAVIGLSAGALRRVLTDAGVEDVDIANDNSPTQLVLSGPRASLLRLTPMLRQRGATIIELRVSAAFHSRYMKDVRLRFAKALAEVNFAPLRFPVVSNVEAALYDDARLRELLARQVDSPVRWTESVQLMLARNERTFVELGPTKVLTKLIHEIQSAYTRSEEPAVPRRPAANGAAALSRGDLGSLGSAAFREAYGVRLAYVAGAMYKGIASKELVARMGRARLLSFLGTGGLRLDRIESDLHWIRRELSPDLPFGANLLSNLDRPEVEDRTVDLFLGLGIRNIEAAAYVQPTAALVRFRLKGLSRDAAGAVVAPNKIVAKLSRPEVAKVFMNAAPSAVIEALARQGLITGEEATLAPHVPLASDVCVEADSGGHTDRGVQGVLLPTMLRLRSEIAASFPPAAAIRIGAAGGIGTPEAAACAFLMGADFILTGSINQCTVEAGTSAAAKDILETLDIHDTTYAPAGDMFEIGSIVQVVRRGLLFPAKGNRLYALYQQHDAWEDIDDETRRRIEEKYFRRSFAEVWAETKAYYDEVDPEVARHAERAPKKKLALVFRWFFIHTSRLALRGDREQKVDYQIHCGPALGAFNRWMRGTPLERWRARHVDEIAELLMREATGFLGERLTALTGRRDEARSA